MARATDSPSDDALLDVVQTGVVLVQDPPRAGDVVGVLGP
jgi:hypothetical protein